MNCKNFPSYEVFKQLVLSAPPRSYKAWLLQFKKLIGDLPDEEIAHCIEELYNIPASFFPHKIYVIVKYRELLLDIYEFLKSSPKASLKKWSEKKGVGPVLPWEVLNTFGFKSPHELRNVPSKNELLMLSPKKIPWKKQEIVPKTVTEVVMIDRETWNKLKIMAERENTSVPHIIQKIIKKSVK